MRLSECRPGLFYASPSKVRRWVEGWHRPGLYVIGRDGRSRCAIPTGRKVLSMYGEKP